LARDLEDLPPRSRDDVVAALSEKSGVTGVLLDREGRKRLIDSGWEVGFHTRRHDALPALDDDALLRAVGDGRDALPDTPLPSFAYPHGKATEREATAVRSAGYVVAFTGAAGVVREDTDPHMIPRMQPSWSSVASTVLALARILAA
jgi:peptidoglycan/xylan/chitin deacetylase (PgdA/CDA1 family)